MMHSLSAPTSIMANPATLSEIELAVLTMALASDELRPTVSEFDRDATGNVIERTDDALADTIIASSAAWRRTPEIRARVLQQLAVERARKPRTVEELKRARAALTAVSRGRPPENGDA